ncbi:hypothetical protein ACFLU6_10130 [Acidobacteriota bacterium]
MKQGTKRALLVTAILIVVSLRAVSSEAWDGDRKGLVVGVGVGYGYSTFAEFDNKSGIFTSFKIGYAPNEHIMLLYHGTQNFASIEDRTAIDAVHGLSFQLYPSKTTNFFVLGGGGYSYFGITDKKFGYGFKGGAGFDFGNFLGVEGTIQQNINDIGNSTSFGITFNIFVY